MHIFCKHTGVQWIDFISQQLHASALDGLSHYVCTIYTQEYCPVYVCMHCVIVSPGPLVSWCVLVLLSCSQASTCVRW